MALERGGHIKNLEIRFIAVFAYKMFNYWHYTEDIRLLTQTIIEPITSLHYAEK